MAIIYENDLLFSASKLAIQDMNKWYDLHRDEIDSLPYPKQIDLWNSLYRRAFHPKALVCLSMRLKKRGHEIVRGDNPVERLAMKRHRERFLSGLTFTINSAIERAATWH